MCTIFCYPLRLLKDTDLKYLRKAVELAWAGLGRNSPNPLVGCVLVRNDLIVGRGVHIYDDVTHAEAAALQDAGDKANGSTLYVNLEPCNHHGRTPPCTEAILAAGVKRVVYGINDPNREVRGGGALWLASNGVSVEKCNDVALIKAIEEQNRFFLTHKRLSRPYITYKTAASLDGRIATSKGHSRWITHPEARSLAHLLRGVYDAILVGCRTAREDNPQLTYRPDEMGTAKMPDIIFPHTPENLKTPLRVILDAGLKLPSKLKIFDTNLAPTVVVAADDAPEEAADGLSGKGVGILRVPHDGISLDLHAAMRGLAAMGIQSLLIEGGGETAGGFLDADLIDEVYIIFAPAIIGGRDAIPMFGGEGVARLIDAKRLTDFSTRMIGPDLLVAGKIMHE
jgi:diaminohydroxyphosphoribosylaminopyrimidine deaminase/5-amino-6-(5-phosphoribosylamino)uracil reductase